MEAYQFKINLYLVQERLVLKKISILWGLRSKGMVFFSFFSLNTYFLAHREMSLSLPFTVPVPLEGKVPKHQQCAGQSSLGGLRAVTHRVGELQHLITKGPCSVSQGFRHHLGASEVPLPCLPPDPKARGPTDENAPSPLG